MATQNRFGSTLSAVLSRGRHKNEDGPLLFNEAVNFDKRAIFIAVPKTGTTSIRRQLTPKARFMISNPHLTALQVRDGLYGYMLARNLGRNRDYPTDPADVPSDAEVRRSAQDIYDGFFKFASVRNPWARVLSLYKRREGVRMAKNMDFDTFCAALRYASDTCTQPTRVANQLDWMTDETGALLVDFVLRLEDHDAGVAQINDITDGRLGLVPQHLNRNPEGSGHSYRDAYSSAARDHVAKVCARDIDYFGYEF